MENEPWLHERKLPRSGPDGLEAWGVAIAASFINFVMAGINRTSGILYVQFIDVFQADRRQASLPFTIRAVTRNLLGPVVGILGQKYGVRPVIIIGGIIGTLSTALCFFAEDILWMSIFWGGFSGLGAAMIMTLTQAAIGEHFVKHKSTAAGIGFSGGCFGSFVFPVLFESLIDEYSLEGTFLFIAGIIMHVIPAAIILKQPSWLKHEKKKQNLLQVNGDINSYATAKDCNNIVLENEINYIRGNTTFKNTEVSSSYEITRPLVNNLSNYQNSLTGNQNYRSDIDFVLLWNNRELVVRLLMDNYKVNLPHPHIIQDKAFYNDSQMKEIKNIFCKIVTDVYNDKNIKSMTSDFQYLNRICDEQSTEKNITYLNGNANLHVTETIMFNSRPIEYLRLLLEKLSERDKNDIGNSFPDNEYEDISKILDELNYIHTILENNQYNESSSFGKSHLALNESDFDNSIQNSNSFASHIRTAMWLHAKPLFLLTCLCRSSHFMTFMPIVTTVVDFSRDKGLPENYGKYVIGALACGDLIGRLLTGWITDKKYLTLPRYMFIFMVLQSIFTISLALANSTETLLFVLIVYGLLQGCTFIQFPVLISHYMGKNEQSIALGCLNFFPGLLGFAMPFYIGYFRDNVGSYDGMFYINGSIGTFIGFLWLAEPYLLKLPALHSSRRQPTKV